MTMKKVLAVFLALTILIVLPAVAANSLWKDITVNTGVKLQLNGESFVPVNVKGEEVEVFLYQGTTYVPIRAISQAFGASVGWDGANLTAIINEAEEEQEATVYITRTGSKYHHDRTCNGGTYWPVPLDTATGMGLTPCKKCVN